MTEIEVPDAPASWAALGFAPDAGGVVALGGVAVRLVGPGGAVALRVPGLRAERPDGLPVVAGGADARAGEHPNGASAVDHLVVITDDRDRTAGALATAGGSERRRGGPPELPAPMAFVRFGPLIVEVVEAGGPARIWGLTVMVPDVDALAGPLLGEARAAVQPGRRIATVRRSAGLSIPLALISP